MKNKRFWNARTRISEIILCVLFIMLMVVLFWPETAYTNIDETKEAVEIEAQPVVITDFPEPLPQSPRYGFTGDDIYLMSVLLTGSKTADGDGEFDFDYGRDTEYDQISLVLCVVMNRVRSEEFPNTVSEVIWQTGQFSPMHQWQKDALPQVSDISLQRVTEWCNAYDNYDSGVQCIPEDHLYFSGDMQHNYSRNSLQ